MSMSTKHLVGTVESFNAVTGMAHLKLVNQKPASAEFHMGAFFSGRSARTPESGDKVKVQLQKGSTGDWVVVVARLADK